MAEIDQIEWAHSDTGEREVRGSCFARALARSGGKKAGENLLPRHPTEFHACGGRLSVTYGAAASDNRWHPATLRAAPAEQEYLSGGRDHVAGNSKDTFFNIAEIGNDLEFRGAIASLR
jgi:hypothetical protein